MASILFVAPSAYVLGGLASWLDYVDPGLRSRGWDVVVGLVEGPKYHRTKEYLSLHPHANWLAIPCLTGTPEGRQCAVLNSLKHVIPDLVVTVNIPDAILGTYRWCNKTRKKVKTVMTVHGIQPDLYSDIRQYHSFLDGVACTNRLACRLTAELGRVEEQRIHYAPCGTCIKPLPEKKRSTDRLRIAYVGRLNNKEKRINDIPLILQELKMRGVPFELIVAGSGPDLKPFKENLHDLLKDDYVRMPGQLTTDELEEQVYKKVDILLITSKSETGPIVVWEAMAHGVVVVSSQYIGSGLEGALEHRENSLLFPVGEVDVAANNLARLWYESDLWEELREQAWNMIKQQYSIETSIEKWDIALRTILNQKPLSEITTEPKPRSRGRLDTLLGQRLGEFVRQRFRRGWVPLDPGDEWPHTHSGTPYHEPRFWDLAKKIDHSYIK